MSDAYHAAVGECQPEMVAFEFICPVLNVTEPTTGQTCLAQVLVEVGGSFYMVRLTSGGT